MKKAHITGLDGSYLAKMLLPKGTVGRRTKLLQEHGLDVPMTLED
jgi:GDP-D-mannose dehydratase